MFKKLLDKITTPTEVTPTTSAELDKAIAAAAAIPWSSHIHGGAAMSTINAGMGVAGTVTAAVPSAPITSGYASVLTTTAGTTTYAVAGGGGYVGSGYAGGTLMGTTMYGGGTAATMAAPNPNVITFSKAGVEIVKLTNEGEVIWADGIKIDEAADAFSKSLSLGAEVRAGLTQKVKCNIRDNIFQDLIAIAKEKGALSTEDLTLMLEASKIIERLKGIN